MASDITKEPVGQDVETPPQPKRRRLWDPSEKSSSSSAKYGRKAKVEGGKSEQATTSSAQLATEAKVEEASGSSVKEESLPTKFVECEDPAPSTSPTSPQQGGDGDPTPSTSSTSPIQGGVGEPAPSTSSASPKRDGDGDPTPNKTTAGDEEDTSKLVAEVIGEVAGNVQEKKDCKGDVKLDEALYLSDLDIPGTSHKDDKFVSPEPKTVPKDLHSAEELVLDQKDEESVKSYIMTDEEVKNKTLMWMQMNAEYLKEQKIKERLAKEREEKTSKKLRASCKKRTPSDTATAGEKIEKMIVKKKLSSKINYDILQKLNDPGKMLPPATPKATGAAENKPATSTSASVTVPSQLMKIPPPPPPPPATPAPRPTPTKPVLPAACLRLPGPPAEPK